MINRSKYLCKIAAYFIIIFCLSRGVFASDLPNPSFGYLMSYALQHAPSQLESRSEIKLKRSESDLAKQQQFIPSVHLDASMEKAVYDQPYNQNGINVSNNGYDPSFGIGVDFNLQKLLGSRAKLAKASLQYSRLSEKIKRRNLIRNVKESFFRIRELESEVRIYRGQIKLFSRINRILQQQSRLGVFNQLQREQFAVQRGLLASQMSRREMLLSSEIKQMSAMIRIKSSKLKRIIEGIKSDPPMIYAQRRSLNDLYSQNISDQTIIDNLSSSYRLDQLKFATYSAVPLPTIYLSVHRDRPTMPSHAGPQTISVIGLSYPLDGFFIRSSQKSVLEAQAERTRTLLTGALLDYHRAIRVNLHDLIELREQTKNLRTVRMQAKRLLDKSFLYYAQKRIDAFGTLDIFQKYLTASKAFLRNQLDIRLADSNLEYLLGNKSS